jgi:hypothetical protein
MPELNLKDIAILQAMAYYRFMTALDVTALLFAKGSMTYARGRLSALAGNNDHELNQYLYRFALPSERGNSERIWTLGSKGREYLGDFRERFYCDRVSMPNAPQDMGNPHSVGRSYGGHARREAGIP